MKSYKLVVFDWDGTVMNSIGRIVSSMQNAAQEINLGVPEQRQVENIIGLSLPKAARQLFPEASDEQISQLLASYKTEYLFDNKVSTPLFDGVIELLEGLTGQGTLIAVATGKGRKGLDRVMAETNTTHYFHATRGGDEAESKPHPEMLESLLSALNVDACDALMIGDTSFDLEMAQSANVDSIGVTFGVHPEDVLLKYNPVKIAHDVTELHRYLIKA